MVASLYQSDPYHSELLELMHDLGLDERSRSIDPIDHRIAGAFRYKSLFNLVSGVVKTEVPQWMDILRMMEDEKRFLHTIGVESVALEAAANARRKKTTDEKYFPSLVLLESYNLLRLAKKDRDRFFVKYREVPKDEHVNRTIINCIAVNKALRKAPHFRLPSSPSVVWNLLAAGEDVEVISYDLRHWYHQLPLPSSEQPGKSSRSQKLFSIFDGSRIWEYLTLPMGFSWSCWIAEATFLATLIACDGVQAKRAKVDVQSLQGETPPCWVVWRDEENRVSATGTGWIDNGLIICRSSKHADTLETRVKCVLRACGSGPNGVEIKEGSWKRAPPNVPFEFAGAVWEVSAGGVQWRHKEKNVNKWKILKEAILAKELTNGQVSSLIGMILFHLTLHRLPVGKIHGLIEVASELSKRYTAAQERRLRGGVKAVKDEPFTDLAVKQELKRWLDIMADDPPSWVDRAYLQIRAKILACSDASDLGGGWVHLGSASHVVAEDAMMLGDFNAPHLAGPFWARISDMKQWVDIPINYRELACAMRTVWSLSRVPRGTGRVVIVIGVDNTGAVAWLRTGRCPNVEWNQLLVAFRDFLLAACIEVRVVGIPGIINVGDIPSRNAQVLTDKEGPAGLQKSWEALQVAAARDCEGEDWDVGNELEEAVGVAEDDL